VRGVEGEMGRTGVLGVAPALLPVAVTLVSPFGPALRGGGAVRVRNNVN
jgi:hypothetical protein